jgi:hypothetical protein
MSIDTVPVGTEPDPPPPQPLSSAKLIIKDKAYITLIFMADLQYQSYFTAFQTYLLKGCQLGSWDNLLLFSEG